MDLEDGGIALRLARGAVARALGTVAAVPAPPALPSLFRERRGVFVSWYDHPERRLRGCIGFPEPVLPLEQAVREAAVSAAMDDPRFPPVTAREFPSLVGEVSVLGPFRAVPLAERPREVKVGRDGLVVEEGHARGLLLPQVAPEQGWNREELLDGTCKKAGLEPGAWRSSRVSVFRFEAEVFRELAPGGEVVEGYGVP